MAIYVGDHRYIERRFLAVTFVILSAFFLSVYLALHRQHVVSSSPNHFLGEYAIYGATWVLFIAICLTAHGVLRKSLQSADPFVFPAVTLLTGIGLVLLYRLAPDIARIRANPALLRLPFRQFLWICFGLATMLLTVRATTEDVLEELRRRKYAYVLVSVILIVATSVLGREINGRKLWIGLGPVSIQSVEIVKVLVILFLAGYFTDKALFMRTRRVWRLKVPTLKSTGPFLMMWGLAVLPVFFQRDLGPTFLLFVLFLAMFYVGSSALGLLISGVIAMLMAGIVFYYLHWPSMVHTRVQMWLSPFSASESLAQSLWAIASGGVFGGGLGQGMPEHIPVVYSDFSFSVICEELGFVGGLAVVLLYLTIMLRGYRIAQSCEDVYKSLLATGITTILAVQTLTILGGTTGATPLTGITLPFISYGGSSIVINYALIGLLLRLSAEGCDDR